MAKIWATEKFLYHIVKHYHPHLTLSCSFGSPEGLVLLDILYKINSKMRVFTIDTGRIPQATYDLIDQIRQKYNIQIEVIFPDNTQVEKMTTEKGVNLFYHSVENRQECCEVRKVLPLNRYFQKENIKAYITGLRRDHSTERQSANIVEFKNRIDHRPILKINPLIAWTTDEVWEYVNQHGLLVNSLHAQGYVSVGCAPCSRPCSPGEGMREGRWWWEEKGIPKECGLHYNFEEKGSGI